MSEDKLTNLADGIKTEAGNALRRPSGHTPNKDTQNQVYTSVQMSKTKDGASELDKQASLSRIGTDEIDESKEQQDKNEIQGSPISTSIEETANEQVIEEEEEEKNLLHKKRTGTIKRTW